MVFNGGGGEVLGLLLQLRLCTLVPGADLGQKEASDSLGPRVRAGVEPSSSARAAVSALQLLSCLQPECEHLRKCVNHCCV